MAVNFQQLRNAERRRYVLDNAPALLCALIGRRASTDPVHLIDLAIETAESLFDKIDPAHTAHMVNVRVADGAFTQPGNA